MQQTVTVQGFHHSIPYATFQYPFFHGDDTVGFGCIFTKQVLVKRFGEAHVHYTGADSFVRNGAFATCGVNYTELGTYTADMVVDALVNGNIPEFHVMDGGIITVNTETAAALGLDYSVFSTMAGTVNEVVTTED